MLKLHQGLPEAQLVELVEPVRGLERGTRGYIVSRNAADERLTLAMEGPKRFS